MALVVVTAASSKALTTVANIQTATGIAGVSSALILAASALAVGRCGREFAKERVRETLAGTDRHRLILARTPVLAIVTVTDDGAALDASDYAIEDADGGILYRDAGWLVSRGFAPGAADFPSPDPSAQRFEVTYDGGYWLPSFSGSPGAGDVLLPDAVEMAVIELAKVLHLRRGGTTAGAITSEEVGGEYKRSFAAPSAAASGPGSVAALSPVAEALLAPFERVGW